VGESQAVPLMKAILAHQGACPDEYSHLRPEYSGLEGYERRQLNRNRDLLRHEGFSDFQGVETAEGGYHAIFELRVLGPGLRALHEWPSDDPLLRILADVNALEATTQDSGRKAKLGALREFVRKIASLTAAHAIT
jgi:hypothetical protein